MPISDEISISDIRSTPIRAPTGAPPRASYRPSISPLPGGLVVVILGRASAMPAALFVGVEIFALDARRRSKTVKWQSALLDKAPDRSLRDAEFPRRSRAHSKSAQVLNEMGDRQSFDGRPCIGGARSTWRGGHSHNPVMVRQAPQLAPNPPILCSSDAVLCHAPSSPSDGMGRTARHQLHAKDRLDRAHKVGTSAKRPVVAAPSHRGCRTTGDLGVNL